jgi:hypothetical protein
LGGFVRLIIVRDLDKKGQKYYKEKDKSTVKEVRLDVSGEDLGSIMSRFPAPKLRGVTP